MGYHHPGQTNPYPQGNVQGGQPQDSGYQRTSRSHSHQPSVQTGDNPTLNRSLSTGRTPVAGQTQPFDAYGTGQNREAGLHYVPSPNTPQYIGAQGQVQSPSFQDPGLGYQPDYFSAEGSAPHLVSQQTRTHQSPPQPPSVPHNPSHSVQGQYSQYQRGDVEYPTGHVQQRRPSSSQFTQQQSPTELFSPQSQSSPPQYHQQHQQHQASTQPYSQHQQSPPLQQRRQYQTPAQQYPQGQQQQQQTSSQQQFTQQHQQPSSRPYTQQQQQQSLSQQYTQQQQQPSSQQHTQLHQSQPHRQQGNFVTTPVNATPSFGGPGEFYEVPGEETRQSRSTRRTPHVGPLCRLENCRNPAVKEVATQELSEYCSLEHMQEDIHRGAILCPACNKCPRRINGRYCGSPCEKWDMDRQRQPQRQQQHYPKPPTGARPHLSTPSSPPGNVNWGTAASEPSHVGNYAPDNQHLLPLAGGLVHCPKCKTTYTARGSSRARYGGQGNPVDVPLPPCPTCGFR